MFIEMKQHVMKLQILILEKENKQKAEDFSILIIKISL